MTNPSILQISGESGGGQLLRSSLSLAMLTGRAFQLTNIRGKRPKPGLMRQHLTCVKAAAEVCGALVEGAEMGSTELVFKPGTIAAGDNHVRSLPARARSYAPHPGYFIVIHPMDRYCRGYDKIRS